jgi:ABC-type nickel/cobalt efflux system permease component RcnA
MTAAAVVWLAAIPAEGGLAMAAVVALLLGLRHATDPDHLTAVTTLVLSERPGGAPATWGSRAGRLGLAWGAGHATTLFALGLPVVLLGRELPAIVGRVAELAVGALIAGLAVRLLLRWRRGYFHSHPHRHGEEVHAHPHLHDQAPAAEHAERGGHDHAHAADLGRSPAAAYGIGLVHGVGGSAGAGVLVVAALPAAGLAALAMLAAGTALSMWLMSVAFGFLLVRGEAAHRLEALAPVLGTASLLFGVWYAWSAF